MMEQVYKNVYRNEIPLPNNPLRAINSYIILSEDRNLIIDSGFDTEECRQAFMNGIEELGLDLNKTDLLVTHLHADHSGLAAVLSKQGFRVYSGETDGNMINKMATAEYWNTFNDYKKLFSLTQDNINFDDHPGYKFSPKEPVDFILLHENDEINIGEFSFKVVNIPGHTPGHIGLYEEEHKLFFCGDHILGKITPNIAFWGFEYGDMLEVYLKNLRKIYDYDINYLFPAHRFIIKDHKTRINELISHHESRLDEVMNIIKEEKKTVRDTAASMHWELRYDKWEDFPNPQKWFASGEAMSHLEHLLYMGKVERTEENGVLYYKLK